MFVAHNIMQRHREWCVCVHVYIYMHVHASCMHVQDTWNFVIVHVQNTPASVTCDPEVNF